MYIHDVKLVHMDIDDMQHKKKCVCIKDVVDGKCMSCFNNIFNEVMARERNIYGSIDFGMHFLALFLVKKPASLIATVFRKSIKEGNCNLFSSKCVVKKFLLLFMKINGAKNIFLSF